jgi:opacity protein-like surface antigen
MSFRKLFIASALVVTATITAPATASADWLFTPFIGVNWGGTATTTINPGEDFEDEFERRMNFGASLGWMGAGIAGFEIDFGYSPNFFEQTTGEDNFEFGDSNVTTVMGNVVLGAPVGGQTGLGIRPYAVGGIGIIKSRIDNAEQLFDVDKSSWGFNVGGGVTAFLSDSFGLRGDVRYFRSLQDKEQDGDLDIGLADFRFWRGTLGATFRF